MSHSTTPTKITRPTTFLMLGVLGTALAGCDSQQTGSSSPAPGGAAQPTPGTAGATTGPGDATAAVPMDDAAGTPATPWPAGGAPPEVTDAAPATDAPAPVDAAPADTARAGAAPAPAPAAAAATGKRESAGGLSFELAEGWTLKPATGMRIGTVTDGEVEIALSSFGGDVGGKLANVNRWRQQVGLAPITEAELDKETRTIEVDGKQVMIVDAAGPEMRLLAASIPGDGKIFFARLMGPAEQVGARKDAFEALVKSMKVE